MRGEHYSAANPQSVEKAHEPSSAEGAWETGQKDHFLRLMLFQPSGAGSYVKLPQTNRAVLHYGPLLQSKPKPEVGFHLPDPAMSARVRVDSPAIEVMTDLRRVAAITIDRMTPVDEANQAMITYGVRALFVVDDNRRLAGIVTAADILGEKPILLTQQRGIRHHEILVRDVMTPADKLEVIELGDVLCAQVGHVVATLKRAGRQHALVVDQGVDDTGDERQMVRGIFSLTQIARQLGITPQTQEIPRTFAEIEAVIGG